MENSRSFQKLNPKILITSFEIFSKFLKFSIIDIYSASTHKKYRDSDFEMTITSD